MTRRLTWLLALAALVALAVAPTGVAGSKKGYKLSRGTTTITLDGATAAALAGIEMKALKPAKVGEGDGQFVFPVTTGRALVSTTTGRAVVTTATVKHVGGLKLTKGDKSLRVRNLWVSFADGAGKVTARLVGGKRFVLATFDGGTVDDPVVTGKRHRTVSAHAVLKLDPAAADALAKAFDLDPASLADATLGTADLTTRIVGKGPKVPAPKAEAQHGKEPAAPKGKKS